MSCIKHDIQKLRFTTPYHNTQLDEYNVKQYRFTINLELHITVNIPQKILNYNMSLLNIT